MISHVSNAFYDGTQRAYSVKEDTDELKFFKMKSS
jgi:hypothetical protein